MSGVQHDGQSVQSVDVGANSIETGLVGSRHIALIVHCSRSNVTAKQPTTHRLLPAWLMTASGSNRSVVLWRPTRQPLNDTFRYKRKS